MPRKSRIATAANPGPARPVDEKLSINLGCVDLGQIDLLVQEGFYANRTDLIRTAIRNQLATHQDVVRQVVERKTLVLGIQHYSAADLAAVLDAGERLQIRVLGLATIALGLLNGASAVHSAVMARPQRRTLQRGSRLWADTAPE